MNAATKKEMERLVRVNREQQVLLDQIHQYVDGQGLAKLGQSRVNTLIEAHKQAEEALKQVAYCNEVGFLPESVQHSVTDALATCKVLPRRTS